jgi:gluconate 2-dehydrogenase gamma chain
MTDIKIQLSRRNMLKSLSLGAAIGSVLRTIPLEAAEFAHSVIDAERSVKPAGYVPKYFGTHQYKMLRTLCDTILPTDADSGGALEAGAPEFIDLLTSENPEYQLRFGGGLMWLDSTCVDRYGHPYLDCKLGQKKEILDLIAYRKNTETDPTLSQGVEFFAFLRNFTADGFFTSKIGIQYLGYVGNSFLTDFPGCPPVRER